MRTANNTQLPPASRYDQIKIQVPSLLNQLNYNQPSKQIPNLEMPKVRSISALNQNPLFTTQVNRCIHRTYNALNDLQAARNKSQEKRSIRMSSVKQKHFNGNGDNNQSIRIEQSPDFQVNIENNSDIYRQQVHTTKAIVVELNYDSWKQQTLIRHQEQNRPVLIQNQSLKDQYDNKLFQERTSKNHDMPLKYQRPLR